MKLIVGLGNPGKQYEQTRHNTGFLVIEKLADSFEENATWKKRADLKAVVADAKINRHKILLAKPTTFMNNSGEAVQALLHFYKLSPADLIVIHDDTDVPLGEYRIQTNRGAAGHNGVASIIEHLGTKNFSRVRIGLAPSPAGRGTEGEGASPVISDTAAFVLGKFTKEEQKILHEVIENVVAEVKKLVV